MSCCLFGRFRSGNWPGLPLKQENLNQKHYPHVFHGPLLCAEGLGKILVAVGFGEVALESCHDRYEGSCAGRM